MFKRPIPRSICLPSVSPMPPPTSESFVLGIIRFEDAKPPSYTHRVPVPIWQPPEHPPQSKPKPVERAFPEHVCEVYRKFSPRLPPLKALCDAMKLDGYPEAKIKQARDHRAKMNRTIDQRQVDLEKIFGRYNAKVTKPVKKVLKVVKKRNAAE